MLIPSFFVGMFSVAVMVLGAGVVSGQTYPNKPLRIVTTAAGGGSDFAARIIAEGISGPLGQPVIVDNRGNIVGIEVVMRAPPDGYTLLLAGGTFTSGSLMRKTSHDPVRDFSPITLAGSTPNILVVHPSLPVKSVKELIALAKAEPGALNYASTGAGTSAHLATELFKSMAGVNMVHIAYKGTAPAVIGLLGGEAQLLFNPGTVLMPHVKAGRLRALAVASAQPSALTPGLPTVAASGVPGYESGTGYNIMAPAKTPEVIVNRLNQEIVRVLNRADVKEKFFNVGVETVGNSPAEFAAALKSEIARLGKLIKDAGIRVE